MGQVYLINYNTISQFKDISTNVKLSRLNMCIKEMQDLDLLEFFGQPLYYDFIKYFELSGLYTANIQASSTTAANGTFTNVNISATSGSGINAQATVVVNGGIVISVTITSYGSGFAVGDTFTVAGITNAIFNVASLITNSLPSLPSNYNNLLNGTSYVDKNGHTLIYDGMAPCMVYWTLARFIETDAYRFTSVGPVTKNDDYSSQIEIKELTKLVAQMRSKANSYANKVERFLYDQLNNYALWRPNESNKNMRQPGAIISAIDSTKYNGPSYNDNNNGSIGFNEFLTF